MDNINIVVRSGLFRNGGVNALIGNFVDQVQSYDHTIAANEGYKAARFVLNGDQVDLEDWLDYGLARDITTYDETRKKIWNGFINKISIVVGGRTLTRGPVLDIVNQLIMQYTPLDVSVSPPVFGNTTPTAVASALDSQAIYGIIQDVFSAGECTDANAATIQNTILNERKDPELSETLTLGGGSPVVKCECVGYYAYLNVYTYSASGWGVVGTVGLSTKLQNIITASPNAIFSSDYSRITLNNLAVPAVETGERRAWEVIKSEVAKGDTFNTRYTFGIYANRQAIYAPVPTEYSYQFRLAEGKVERYGGGEIMPWDILPARWLFYPDFMAGRSVPSILRQDPRALSIEEATFTAPMGISLNGGKTSTTPQLLARLGLGGM